MPRIQNYNMLRITRQFALGKRKKPPIEERCDSRMHAFMCMNVCLFVWDWIFQIFWWIRIRMRSTEARVNDSSFAISIYLFKIDLLQFTVCHTDGMLSCCDLIIIIFVRSFCILFLFVFIFFCIFAFVLSIEIIWLVVESGIFKSFDKNYWVLIKVHFQQQKFVLERRLFDSLSKWQHIIQINR